MQTLRLTTVQLVSYRRQINPKGVVEQKALMSLFSRVKERLMMPAIDTALKLLERIAVALEALVKPHPICTAVNVIHHPQTKCMGQVGHSGMHSNADGSIRW